MGTVERQHSLGEGQAGDPGPVRVESVTVPQNLKGRVLPRKIRGERPGGGDVRVDREIGRQGVEERDGGPDTASGITRTVALPRYRNLPAGHTGEARLLREWRGAPRNRAVHVGHPALHGTGIGPRTQGRAGSRVAAVLEPQVQASPRRHRPPAVSGRRARRRGQEPDGHGHPTPQLHREVVWLHSWHWSWHYKQSKELPHRPPQNECRRPTARWAQTVSQAPARNDRKRRKHLFGTLDALGRRASSCWGPGYSSRGPGWRSRRQRRSRLRA